MLRFGFQRGQSADMHTHTMAAAGSSNSIGSSASAESFAQRRAVHYNRQHVAGFDGANIVRDYRDESLSQPASQNADTSRGSRFYDFSIDGVSKNPLRRTSDAVSPRPRGRSGGRPQPASPAPSAGASRPALRTPASHPHRYNPYS